MEPVARCGLIKLAGQPVYLRCKLYDGIKETGKYWYPEITNFEEQGERFICTNDEGYATAENYGRELERWISANCK